ncbi:MAG: hypothetical protein HQ541_02705 [Mariniphaga sp.]|nr:hypothetical protein [Mariniphaga sp.]
MKTLKLQITFMINRIKNNFFINHNYLVPNNTMPQENPDYEEYLINYKNTTRWQTV